MNLYRTRPGDRWDLIAYRAYGSVAHQALLIEANPGIPPDPVLPEGLAIRVPDLPAAQAEALPLPPWKRPI